MCWKFTPRPGYISMQEKHGTTRVDNRDRNRKEIIAKCTYIRA